MSALWRIFGLMWRAGRVAFLRGAVLGFAVLAMGGLLLGLSGWFITAAAAAGLAGTGAVFDVFRPSAMVRLLALSRAAARYGERLLTHDATLRALEALRLRLLAGLLAAPADRLVRLRGAQALNRLTADIEALDGVALRLVLPLVSGALVLAGAFALLWWLIGLPVAALIAGGLAAGAGLVLWRGGRRTLPLSRREAAAAQVFRTRLIDLIAARRDLAVYGRLAHQADAVRAAETRRADMARRLDRAERSTGAALAITAVLVASGALGLGIWLEGQGQISAALAACGFFAALALAEVLMPLRRAVAELGRMRDAARRVAGAVGRDEAAPVVACADHAGLLPLVFDHVTLARPGEGGGVLLRDLSLSLPPGSSLALTGPSGAGKSTLLWAAAGLIAPVQGRILLGTDAVTDLPEPLLRARLGLLPQRSALMAGSVAEALRLAAPEATDAQLWQALEAVQLAGVIAARGGDDPGSGLNWRLGPRGEGLSGGEARRLALARVLLARPQILLLDEPTEGLDADTATRVLAGIRSFLPDATLLIAAHRPEEIGFAAARLDLGRA